MFSGRYSKAREFAATCRGILKPEEFTRDNIFDRLNEASAAHKEKLCKRLVQQRLGISFDRFLKKGEQELTPEVRNRVLYDIEQLNFGCSLIIFGFIDGVPRIYVIDEDGEVVFRENFAAIGTGYVVAESILYYREQGASKYLERTLYNLYEAFAMTYQARAPGVGEVPQAAVHRPGEDGRIQSSLLMSAGVEVLAACFEKFGPKPVKDVPKLDAECLMDDEEAYRRLDVLLQNRAFS